MNRNKFAASAAGYSAMTVAKSAANVMNIPVMIVLKSEIIVVRCVKAK